MKVCHLAQKDDGEGACQAVFKLHSALLQQGLSSRISAKAKYRSDPTIVAFLGWQSFFLASKAEYAHETFKTEV